MLVPCVARFCLGCRHAKLFRVLKWSVANGGFEIFHVRQHHCNVLTLSRKRCIQGGFAVFAFTFDLGEYLTAGLLELESKLFFYRISAVIWSFLQSTKRGERCYWEVIEAMWRRC